MKIPKDWDKPSEGNTELVRKFEYGEYLSYGKLLYRLFKPAVAAEKVPIVIYLHGADAFGNDNEEHLAMHDIGTVFARDSWQAENPCFILAPQCKVKDHWSLRSSGGLVIELIKKLINEDKRIDENRVYIYGYSAGGIGALRLVKERPEIFSAAVSICGATEKDKFDILNHIPLWMCHAADDDIVRCTYSSDSFFGTLLGSKDIYNELKKSAVDIHYTEYPVGFMKEKYGVNPHCSWVPAGEDEEMKQWLFGKHKICTCLI